MTGIGICCMIGKHAALRGKNKYWLVRNHAIVCEWSDTSIELYFLSTTITAHDYKLHSKPNNIKLVFVASQLSTKE